MKLIPFKKKAKDPTQPPLPSYKEAKKLQSVQSVQEQEVRSELSSSSTIVNLEEKDTENRTAAGPKEEFVMSKSMKKRKRLLEAKRKWKDKESADS